MLDDVITTLPESDEKLGEMIYRAVYEHQGGKWWANESKDVWYHAAKRLRDLCQ